MLYIHTLGLSKCLNTLNINVVIYKYILFTFLICTVSNLHSQNQCIDSSLICDSCSCIALYDPVIGCNGAIYSNSCYASINGVIYWIPYLDDVNIIGPSQINLGDSAILQIEHKDIPAAVSYEWNHGDNGKEIIVKPDASTMYIVNVIVSYIFDNGTSITDENEYAYYVEVKAELSNMNFISENNTFKVFPNPASFNLNIISDNTIKLIQIMDFKGVIVKDLKIQNNNTIIDISNLHSGLYFIKVHINDSILFRKVLIEKTLK